MSDKNSSNKRGESKGFPTGQQPPINLWAANQQQPSKVQRSLPIPESISTAPLPKITPLDIDTTAINAAPNQDRAIHRIHLSSIRHNYNVVQTAAAKQQCQVIVVVKADGYGHGAIMTTCHLIERCGAGAFAVATLEEGIALRKALDERFPPGCSTLTPRVRILVLGAPINYPSCFDMYLHYDIEVMVSGPEVAASLSQWMRDHDGRRRAEVFRVAESRKEELMGNHILDRNPIRNMVVRQDCQQVKKFEPDVEKESQTTATFSVDGTMTSCSEASENINQASQTQAVENSTSATARENFPSGLNSVSPRLLQTKMIAATLTNVTGHDLAKEVRQILISQKHAASEGIKTSNNVAVKNTGVGSTVSNNPVDAIDTVIEERDLSATENSTSSSKDTNTTRLQNISASSSKPLLMNGEMSSSVKNGGTTIFCGIEDAAKASRQKELRMRRLSQSGTQGGSAVVPLEAPSVRKKLRWHALVDSGMGRLGFKTEQVSVAPSRSVSPAATGDCSHSSLESDVSVSDISSSWATALKRDTVEIIQELYDAEVHEGAPIEFYGMCTHMADANDKSTYTHDQMDRFRSLIRRVRSAGIAIPTISTDNSAALLTTSLTHFDPDAILSHDTRGFVRTGGAIYGQRPAFKQLRAVSTLVATVSNVAIIHRGESVGYDRAYVATADVRIATLTIGFADGYPRELGNGVGRVSIRGSTFPVAGNVCMDMLMVELGAEGDRGVGSLVTIGDTAVLWGPEGTDFEESGNGLVQLAELASTLKTTQSALTCGLDKIRVQRQLVE